MSNNQNQGASIEAAKLLPCPFCGVGGVKAGAHKDDCYFSLCAALRDAPKGDLTSVPDILASWSRRTPAAAAGAGELPPLPKKTWEQAPYLLNYYESSAWARGWNDAVAALAAPASAQPADLKEVLVELTATQRKLIDANAEIAAMLLERGAQPDQRESAAEASIGWAECGCHACNKGRVLENGWPIIGSRMILCPTCGNKRCPHATDHRHACTNSNEPGQPGSIYRDSANNSAEGEKA